MRYFFLSIFVYLIVSFASNNLCAASSFPDKPEFQTTLGINFHFNLYGTEDQKAIDLTEKLGFTVARVDFTWTLVEPQAGIYQFAEYDKLIEQLSAKHIRPLFILNYGNPIYGKNSYAVRTPNERRAYANFAATAAARYKNQGVIWEIWNEPNIGLFWKPAPNVEEYVEMAIEASNAIRAADPNATIIAPATSVADDWDFLEKCFKKGLLNYIDAVSVHPYRKDAPGNSVLKEYEKLRKLIAKYQPKDRKISIVASEWGYSASRMTTKTQGEYAARMFLINAAAGIPVTIWYDFRNDGTDPKNSEHNFGLTTNTYEPKRAYYTLQDMAIALKDMHFEQRLPSDANDYLLVFSDDYKKNYILAAWTEKEKEHDLQLPDKRIIRLTGSPQYIPFVRTSLGTGSSE